jgi:amino acid transporter
VLAAWQLRRKLPELKRPFRIPGGKWGLAYAVAAPIIMSVVAMLGSDRYGAIGGAIALALGPLIYSVLQQISPSG